MEEWRSGRPGGGGVEGGEGCREGAGLHGEHHLRHKYRITVIQKSITNVLTGSSNTKTSLPEALETWWEVGLCTGFFFTGPPKKV